jgi:hypothetical protein
MLVPALHYADHTHTHAPWASIIDMHAPMKQEHVSALVNKHGAQQPYVAGGNETLLNKVLLRAPSLPTTWPPSKVCNTSTSCMVSLGAVELHAARHTLPAVVPRQNRMLFKGKSVTVL